MLNMFKLDETLYFIVGLLYFSEIEIVLDIQALHIGPNNKLSDSDSDFFQMVADFSTTSTFVLLSKSAVSYYFNNSSTTFDSTQDSLHLER